MHSGDFELTDLPSLFPEEETEVQELNHLLKTSLLGNATPHCPLVAIGSMSPAQGQDF